MKIGKKNYFLIAQTGKQPIAGNMLYSIYLSVNCEPLKNLLKTISFKNRFYFVNKSITKIEKASEKLPKQISLRPWHTHAHQRNKTASIYL